MSALPPKADMCGATRDVRFGPIADVARYSIICASLQCRRYAETERLGGLQIDHQFIPGRHLHRQVGRLLSLENTIDIRCCASKQFNPIRPIGDQTSVGSKKSGKGTQLANGTEPQV